MEPRSNPPLVGIVFATLLCAAVLMLGGIWLGGHPADLPGFMRNAFVGDHSSLVVNEAIDRIARDYYRPISKDQLNDASVAGAVASLDDRFSHYLTPAEFHGFDEPASFTGIGVEVDPAARHRGLLVVTVFEASPAQRSGLQPGDVIVAVNGRSLSGLSPEADTALIKGPPGTDVHLTLQRRRGRRTVLTPVTVTREVISEPVVASAMRTVAARQIGIVRLATFSLGAHGEMRNAVEHLLHEGARGLVFDLRANGGGLVEEARLIASIFLPGGAVVVSTRGRTQPSQTLVAAGDPIPAQIPMAVLVDGNTASASEIVTAALQDHRRATVVGTHTFGKGVFQEEEPLSNGGALDITVGEYFTPNGRNLGGGGVKQGAGIHPEVAVPASQVDGEGGLRTALATVAAKLR